MDNEFEKEILNWKLAAYGKIIRGDEDTSEDQIAEAATSEMARLLTLRFNQCTPTNQERLEKLILTVEHNFQNLKEMLPLNPFSKIVKMQINKLKEEIMKTSKRTKNEKI